MIQLTLVLKMTNRTGCQKVIYCQQQQSSSMTRSPWPSCSTFLWNDSGLDSNLSQGLYWFDCIVVDHNCKSVKVPKHLSLSSTEEGFVWMIILQIHPQIWLVFVFFSLKGLVQLGKERRARLEDSLRLYKFFGDMEEEEMFVKETEKVLSSKEVGKDLISLTRLQQKHKVSYRKRLIVTHDTVNGLPLLPHPPVLFK